MPELAKAHIRGLTRTGPWGIDNAEHVVEFSAGAVEEFVEQFPEDMREFAIEAISERLRTCRDQLEMSEAVEIAEVK